MGRKKKFIDKKKSATFQLIARDSSDPNYSEGPSGDRVFVRVDGNSFLDGELSDEDDPNGIFDDAPEGEDVGGSIEKQTMGGLPDHVRREIVELGFPDDGYNYLSHLREIKNTGGGSSYYHNPKAKLDQLPRDVKAYDASRIEVSKADDDTSYKNSIYGVAVPVRIKKAIDPEVAALLDDSDASRFGSDVEDLEEDFVFNANLPEDVEHDNRLTFTEESSSNRNKEEHNLHCSQDKFVESSDNNNVINPRERRLLDQQFDLLELQEYGTDSENEYQKATSEDEECDDFFESKVNNAREINSLENDENYKVLSSDKNIEEEPVSLETAADLRPRCIEYAERYENENENEKEDVVFEETSDESEKWDCETIITTYSNLDNHPAKIGDPGVRRNKLTEKAVKAFQTPNHVISLKGKERIPVDFLTRGGKERTKVKSNVVQPKKVIGQESKEEKKERKAAVKEERREARRAKKDLKELYKGESQQALKVAAFTPPSSIHLM